MYSGSGAGASLQSTGILWPLLMILSFFLQAADTVLKVASVFLSNQLLCFSYKFHVIELKSNCCRR
jgi:hypothetical protein